MLVRPRNVLESETAVYECSQTNYVVSPATADGKFHVECRKSGNFKQAHLIDWPVCKPKEAAACDDIHAPENYTKIVRTTAVTLCTLFLTLFTPSQNEDVISHSICDTVSFTCGDPDLLVGDAYTATYSCGMKEDGTYGFLDFDSSLPECREPARCSFLELPDPPADSGLEVCLRSQVRNGRKQVPHFLQCSLFCRRRTSSRAATPSTTAPAASSAA